MPWNLFQSEFFYPNRKDIFDTNSFCIELTCEAESIFRVELRDERKATAKYLSSIVGENSMNKVEKEENTAGGGNSSKQFFFRKWPCCGNIRPTSVWNY